jgi:toxin ParE1/3/4
MKLIWSPTALADLEAIRTYIAENNASASLKVARKIRAAVEGLCDFPAAGRAGRVPETRELAIAGTAYIAAYTVTAADVRIAAILHGSRNWPGSF